MIHGLRNLIARGLIKLAMVIMPSDVRNMVRGILLYHVPGGLTEAEKSEVRKAKWDS